MGPGGPVGLNMLSVNQAMNDYHIKPEERILFSQKAREIASIVIAEQHEEQRVKREQERKKGR